MALPRRPQCINRKAELGAVGDLQATALADGSPLQVLITGGEGMGKTTLAVTLGYQLARDYPDGVLYCDSLGSAPPATASADELARQLLAQLRISDIPVVPADRLAALRQAIAGKHVLIVFDDVHLAEQVAPLLGDISRAAIIVTSRNPLTTLEVHEQFTRVPIRKFEDEDASQLINAIAGRNVLDGVTRGVRERFFESCGGMPLALAVIAARLRDEADSVAEIVDGVGLDEFEIDGDLVVKKVFEAAYRGLETDEQRAYRLLSLLPGPHFGIAAAAAVLDLPERAAKRLIRRLAGRHAIEDSGAGRYRYHFLVREHAIALARVDDWRAITAQANRHYARRAIALDKAFSARPIPQGAEDLYATVEPAYTGPEAAENAAAEFDREWPNLVAAASGCMDLLQDDFATVLPMALWSFAYQSGRAGDLIDLYRYIRDRAATPAVTWQICRDLAGLYEQLGEYDAMEEWADQAVNAGHPQGIASVIEWKALSYESRGQFDRAAELTSEARAAVPAMNDPAHERRSYALLDMHSGRVDLKRGMLTPAKLQLQSARSYFGGRDEDAVNAVRCDEWLGDIARAEGEPRLAEQLWENAVEVLYRHQVREVARRLLLKLADLAEHEDRHNEAAAYRDRAD